MPKETSKVRLLTIFRRMKHAYGPQHWWPAETPLEVILGAILTQNTAWSNVERAIGSLKSKRLLSLKKLTKTPHRKLANTVRPSGFFNLKAQRIKAFLSHLAVHYKGNLQVFLSQPAGKVRGELLSIKGIGPETADSIVLYAARKPLFVVDAYTRRIFHRMGHLNGKKASYESIRALFESRLPTSTDLFNEYHALLVRHAKEHCRKKPQCLRCPLEDLCAKKKD